MKAEPAKKTSVSMRKILPGFGVEWMPLSLRPKRIIWHPLVHISMGLSANKSRWKRSRAPTKSSVNDSLTTSAKIWDVTLIHISITDFGSCVDVIPIYHRKIERREVKVLFGSTATAPATMERRRMSIRRRRSCSELSLLRWRFLVRCVVCCKTTRIYCCQERFEWRMVGNWFPCFEKRLDLWLR